MKGAENLEKNLYMTSFCNTTYFCDNNTKVVYTNSIDYYYCTQNSSSDSQSDKQRLELLLFYTWQRVVTHSGVATNSTCTQNSSSIDYYYCTQNSSSDSRSGK